MDIIIEDALIVDGKNEKPYMGDVAIKEQKIVMIGDLKCHKASKRINANGLMLVPGFIDCHCHSDSLIFTPQKNVLRLMQGITTEIIGNCGISATPVTKQSKTLIQDYCDPIFASIPLSYNWQSFGEYLEVIQALEPVLNVAALVGHGTIRANVLGFEDRLATPKEVMQMQKILETCLKQGAIGLSTGLVYPPGFYSDTNELIAFAEVVSKYESIFTTHMKSETNKVVESLEQSIEIARQTGVNMEISHLKASGIFNHGKSTNLLSLIDQAVEDGLNINFDVYPYTAASTQFCAVLPPFMQEGGQSDLLRRLASDNERQKAKQAMLDMNADFENVSLNTTWDKIIISQCSIKAFENKSVQQIAQELDLDVFEATFEILLQSQNQAMMIVYLMDEKDIINIISNPNGMIASDGIPSLNKYHPRYLGSFARVIDYYVKQKAILTLPEAIHKMTLKPATKFNLKHRGCIEADYFADLVLLDYESFKDNTNYERFDDLASGIKMVIINGQIAVEDNEFNGICIGKVIKGEVSL